MKITLLIIITFLLSKGNITAQMIQVDDEADNYLIFSIEFEDENFSLEGENGNVIFFNNSIDESKPNSPVLPSETFFVAIPPESKIDLQILDSDIVSILNVIPKSNPEIILNTDSSLLYQYKNIDHQFSRSKFYPEEVITVEGYTWLRDFYCAVIRINTHRYDWSKREIEVIKKIKIKVNFIVEGFITNNSPLTKFDQSLEKVIINFDQAKEFRSFRTVESFSDSTGDWIDYTKEHVKLQIPNDGVYRINYNDVLNYGITQNVNPKTFRLFRNGKELPLFVMGEDDISFDPGDYIEFWAEKNYTYQPYENLVSQGEEYLTYLSNYSDTSIVWLTWDGDFGRRVSEINSYIPSLQDSITSHLVKIHLEKDNLYWYYGFEYPRIQLPFHNECKTWIWLQVTNTGTSSIPFTANSFVPNTEVKTLSRLNSWFSNGLIQNAHKYGAKLNATGIQDSVIFNFETIANLSATFNSNNLIDGTNNYRISGMPNDSGFTHKAVLDWVDIEYFQYTNAINDSLIITIPDSVNNAERVLKVNNYFSDSASTIIYKIKSGAKKINSFIIVNSTLTFTDTVNGGDKYFVLNQNYLKQPEFIKKKQFINLRDINRQADYIIITHSSLQPSVSAYENFIETNYGLNSFSIFVEDIYDEFGYGYLQPEPLKEFLKYAYFNWQSPKPSYLNLIGDCTYDYKNIFTSVPSPRKQILVPSYGQPVSDIWFTTWDSSNVNVQQMFVGRIPANNNEEVNHYLTKHQNYLQRNYDGWNKKFLLFSGGFPSNPSELDQIKQANDRVLNNIILPPPVGGEAVHFYKTISPPTNFGPYSPEEIQNGLDEGGLFISYIGHSGTRTWDNGVTEPTDIENAYDDRYPVVTDNGCSTGKFAEPDIDAFGELFVNQDQSGQAISYLGNSSLGYTSTAFRMAELFYNRLIVDSSLSIGEAQFLAKIDNFNQSGYGDVNRVYNYSNILLGDPIITLAFPDKPNFVVNQNSVKFIEPLLTDTQDSTDIKIVIANWGRVVEDSLQIDIIGEFSDSTIYSITSRIKSTLLRDSLEIRIPLLGLAGEHTIIVELDKNNLIDETTKLDNLTEVKFNVYSTKVRPIEAENFYNTSRNFAKVLNPTLQSFSQISDIEFALATDPDFTNQTIFLQTPDTVSTKYQFNNLTPAVRYYWRAKLSGSERDWSEVISFYNSGDHSWYFGNSFVSEDIATTNVVFDSSNSNWILQQGDNNLKIGSAGFNDGKYASIQYNFIEYVPNTFFRGFATALIDTLDLKPYDVQSFMTPVTPSRDSLISYLNYLEIGSILAFAATDEVSTFFSGAVGDSLKNMFKLYGSAYVDSIGWRDSWAMIGVKGAPQGSVPEAFSKSLEGPAIIDTSKFVLFTEGEILFPDITNSIKWINVIKNDSLPSGSSINYFPIAIKGDGTIDTLAGLIFNGDLASIDFIDAGVYKSMKISAEFNANTLNESPKIKSLAVNFIPPPELAINYQVVSVTSDTITIGESINLNFSVYNAGETRADSFDVTVELINDDNTRSTLSTFILDSLSANNHSNFNVEYISGESTGSKNFFINIDPQNKITELYEYNNFYTIPFYIKPDTTTPTLVITFDGNDIIDGEYISGKPEIKIELSDSSVLPITDPSAVLVYLNDDLIHSDTSIITYTFSQNNPKVVVDFTPELNDGEYNLRVLGKDGEGNLADSSGVERFFIVSNEAQLLNVYNYPNPTNGETHFTFKLTQIPEEIKIKIFTIAGRLVKEINLTSNDLKFDFNKIYWNGRDEDGDILANGVYLYKVIMIAGDKSEGITQKLAIVR